MKKLIALVVLAASLQAACSSEVSAPASGSRSASTAAPATGKIDLVFTYGSEKEEWLKEVTAAFNSQGQKTASGKTIAVQAIPLGSGECIDELLNGTRQAHL